MLGTFSLPPLRWMRFTILLNGVYLCRRGRSDLIWRALILAALLCGVSSAHADYVNNDDNDGNLTGHSEVVA